MTEQEFKSIADEMIERLFMMALEVNPEITYLSCHYNKDEKANKEFWYAGCYIDDDTHDFVNVMNHFGRKENKQ